ncbi:MAG: biliverdin-producing heme oxygenase [Pseudomonadota bacterium]
MRAEAQTNVRAFLAHATRDRHEGLHRHPLLSQLLASDLSQAEYAACIRINLHFFETIEANRAARNLHHAFSLMPAVTALRADIASEGLKDGTHVRQKLASSDLEVLGALYVAHGSQFGRQVIGKAVAQSLPQTARHYFGAPNDPTLWRALMGTLQTFAEDAQALEEIAMGAKWAFSCFSAFADQSFDLAC